MIEVSNCIVTMQIDRDELYAMHNATSMEAVRDAIGYAVSYGITGEYENVTIRMDRGADFLCIYDRGERRFVMGAIWRPELKRYTFHS